MSSQIILSIIALIITLISTKILKRFLLKIATKKGIIPKRIFYIEKLFHFLMFMTTVVILLLIWSIDIKGVSLFASSVFAVIGVAFFAQWSILSNISSSIIIIFTFPAKVGDKVRIIDKDDSVEGTIKEISLFQVELRDANDNAIFYPNNLFLQKPVKVIKEFTKLP